MGPGQPDYGTIKDEVEFSFPRTHATTPPKQFNLIQKLQAIVEAPATGNIHKTARKWKDFTSNIRK